MKIGIVGCGWLGKPLAKKLCENFIVECFTRKEQNSNSLTYIYKPASGNHFWNNDIIIVAISTKDNYLKTLQKIADYTNPLSTIILMSSTSVYREFDTEVDEKANITKIGLQKEAEDLMLKLRNNLVILRLGGLMGENRISGRWKNISKFSDGFVNYVHRNDVIEITKKLIENNIKNGIFNIVAPNYPLRSQVHKKNSEKFGFELGSFEGLTYRKVLSSKIIKKLNYSFIYPNPLNFWG